MPPPKDDQKILKLNLSSTPEPKSVPMKRKTRASAQESDTFEYLEDGYEEKLKSNVYKEKEKEQKKKLKEKKSAEKERKSKDCGEKERQKKKKK